MGILRTTHSIKVGIPVSLSGQFRVQGQQALTGIQAWVEWVNRSGGLLVSDLQWHFPVSLVYYDDASSTDRTRWVTEELILRDRVDLLFGPYSSALSLAAAGVAEEFQQVLWNQGGASDEIYSRGLEWVVGILTPGSEYLAGLPQLVRRADPNAERLAVIRASTGAFPRAVSDGMERQARELGFRKVAQREFDPRTTNFSRILDQTLKARPDLLLAVGRIRNDLALARELARRSEPLGAAAVVATPIQQFQDALGEDAEGFLGPSQWEPTALYPASYGPSAEQVVEVLSQDGRSSPDYPMVQAFAAGLVAQRCVEEAGTLDQDTLREVASAQDFSTFYGRFKIDPDTGRQIGRSVVLVQRQEGRKVIVWPPEQRQGELVYPWR